MSSKHAESESEASCESSENGHSSGAGAQSLGQGAVGGIPLPSTSQPELPAPPQPPPRGKLKKRGRRTGRSDWEIIESLKEGQTYDRTPKKFEGSLLKKRKWPLKGYHKRYFILENGHIVYGKTGWDIARGKMHGQLDTGLSVITTKPRDGRIDIDAEDCIYHIKIKPKEVYMEWLEQLKQHRLYRQHILMTKGNAGSSDQDVISPLDGFADLLPKVKGVDHEICLLEKDVCNLQGILDTIPQPKKDEDNKYRDFIILSREVILSLRGILRTLGKQQNAREVEGGANTLRLALNQALQQNAELKSRLARINRESDVDPTAYASPHLAMAGKSDTMKSYSSTMSNSEYFDAESEHVEEDRTSSDEESLSSEGEVEGGEVDSVTSEVSEPLNFDHLNSDSDSRSRTLTREICNGHTPSAGPMTITTDQGRRSRLPAPAQISTSIWSILSKNIGKDLSKISMPVTFNEPLNSLQRLCEELEYSELLDAACKEPDPVERMALVAAFAVSGNCSSSFRTHKLFNPILGETYECVREDKNFRFISEQVSHHPPVSACNAEGLGWMFWEETQLKSKFWGRSMEIHSLGEVHIVFPKLGEHYSYHKPTTCIHSVHSPQSRWIEKTGDVIIRGGPIVAQVKFVKAGYFVNARHVVQGTICNENGTVLQNIFGHWNESMFVGQPPSAKCIWRMGTMPEDHAKYYGFTRFAIELNEITPGLREKLPITDTRFRPDQRLLEEGHAAEADEMKLKLEEKQRARRKVLEEENTPHTPLWFKKSSNNSRSGEEQWEFTGAYWDARKTGFKGVPLTPLW